MRKLLIWVLVLWVMVSLAAVVLAPVFLTLLVLVGTVVGIAAYRRGKSATAVRAVGFPGQVGHAQHPQYPYAPGVVVETETVIYRQRSLYPHPQVPPTEWTSSSAGAVPAADPAREVAAADVVPDHVPVAWEEMHREGRA